MKPLNLENDIVPVAEFKTKLAHYLLRAKESGSPLVITQNGRPAGVLISPAEYDRLSESRNFLESVTRGISDIEQGHILTTDEFRAALLNNGK